MPEVISISDFIEETRDDFHNPITSTFVSRIPHCRNKVNHLEECLEADREGLVKMKKAMKQIHQSGTTNMESELLFSRCLERVGSSALDQEPELAAAFLKFAVITKELSNLKKTLMQNLQNMILFPLDSVLKGDIRGVKGELRRPFDKAINNYETRHSKLEKEKKAQAREAGMFRKEVIPAEIADETEKERRLLQLNLSEYLLKANEIKTKKGVELLKHLVEYYHALNSYFQDGLKTMEHFGSSYVGILSQTLTKIRQKQDDERRRLTDIRTLLRTTPVLEKELSNPNPQAAPGSYSLHQMQGNKSVGVTKVGYLNKKSEGKMRRVWQKRKCAVQDGFLQIFHGDEGKQPTKVNLLTCQLKIVSENKKFFDLVSYNRTYHLHSEDEAEEWISVLLNSKEASLSKAFDRQVDNDGLVELTQAIFGHIHRLPGNDKCADCDSVKEVTWLSVNLGAIVCIECSGVHRTLGVGVSRIQSISLDRIPPSLLILSASLGNTAINEILEENLKPSDKPDSSASMEMRTDFIRAKYVDKQFASPITFDAELLSRRVELAIESDDLLLLVRTFAQGAKLGQPLPTKENGETPLHVAVVKSSLPMVDFLVQNSGASDKRTKSGSTPLHYCAMYGKTEPAKLLLRAGVDLQVQDENKCTALDVAKQRGHRAVEDLILHAMEGKKTLFESVDFDWNLGAEDSTDFSDDEATVLDDPSLTPEKKRRPCSFLESPYKSSNSDSRSLVRTPFATEGSLKNSKFKRSAPPPPSPLGGPGHQRSPSDTLIGKYGGRLVLPHGEPPLLRKTSIPISPPASSANSSFSSHIQHSTPISTPYSMLNTSLNISSTAITPTSLPSPVVTSSTIIPNGTKTYPIDLGSMKRCRALYDCEADNNDEISFRQGDIILIVNERTEDDNWMEGVVLDDDNGNRRGMFPVSFVQLLD
ncbi:arfGAP with SH3 domain, ANK repeat and PH domain-containing protein isoform X2 [Folsomia candida]|uniref:arfGAP with SH3 domain, ANK repeat and PH domain-containing protein isoform X2 n=1 Tax=Folsomia candida TaxID=158441 RepID=UPI000B901C96|nr:arfGAP with SH3 domain, ANK repeat and PH domain-containing protein isoform X2 [Folsomia candida]